MIFDMELTHLGSKAPDLIAIKLFLSFVNLFEMVFICPLSKIDVELEITIKQ